MKHTPGPWVADGNEDNAATWVFDPSNKVRICTMRRCEQDWANANLIAAAPDMLAALSALADKIYKPGDAFGSIWTQLPEWIAARAAIAKARGQA